MNGRSEENILPKHDFPARGIWYGLQDTKDGFPSSDKTYTVDEAVNKVGYGLFQHRLLLLAGLAWTADACEIIILSVIGQILACDWEIHRWQSAALTTAVFVGMMFGSPILGIIADKYGRKKSVIAALCLMFSFGSLSAASQSYVWMVVLRACTGFALGGVPQLLTLCCEYCPTEMRGRAGFYLCYFWAIGTVGSIALSWAIMMTTGNWRILLAVIALPSLIVLFCVKWLPESVRYNLITNNIEATEKTLSEMAAMNRKELPVGRLRGMSVQCDGRGSVCGLFTEEHRRSTIIFWYMWCATAFSYYSIALVSPILIEKGSVSALYHTNETTEDFFQGMGGIQPCVSLNNDDYISLLWTSAAELPGLLVFTFLVEMCDRKKLMCGSCVISGILVFFLLVEMRKIAMLSLLFASRAIILSVFQLTLLMTTEAFPTTLRAVAMGTGSAISRLAGGICPYLSQVLIVSNPTAAICILGGIIVLAGISALCLPLETRGMKLMESHKNMER